MLELQQVSKHFWRKKVVHDVSFSVAPEQITCLIGLNGAGKTTLLRGIVGLTSFSSGRVLLDGHPLTSRDLARIAYVPDQLLFDRSLSIGEALRFQAAFYPKWDANKAARLLDYFHLSGKAKLRTLSKGQIAKFNLVLGFAQCADYLLMDEPLSGIDILSREQIIELFYEEHHCGILLTTHEVNELEHIVDQIVMLDGGTVVQQFEPEIVRETTGKSVVDVMRDVYQQKGVSS